MSTVLFTTRVRDEKFSVQRTNDDRYRVIAEHDNLVRLMTRPLAKLEQARDEFFFLVFQAKGE